MGRRAYLATAQHRLEHLAGVAARRLGHLLGRALGDHRAALVAALGPEVDDPVRRLDHVEVVLDDDDRVALVDQPAQHLEQPARVVEVQARRGLVEDVEGVPGRAPAQLAGQLHPLRLAARERRRRLAQADVAQADVDQGLHVAGDGRLALEEARAPPRTTCRARRRWSCPGR